MGVRVTRRTVETDGGPGLLEIHRATGARALLLLGHGAGGGIDAFDLAALAAGLPGRGIAVGLFEQPWRTAGRKVAGPPKTLDAAWLPALRAAPRGLPLVVGGRSAGARVACRCAAEGRGRPLGVVALSFPLHPPGRPERSRAAEGTIDVPLLVLQGEKDPFGTPAEVAGALPGARVVAVPGAAHSLKPTRKGDDVPRAELLVETVAEFVDGLLADASTR